MRPPAKPLTEPQQPAASGGNDVAESSDAGNESADRYSAAHRRLNVMTTEIEQSETSWRTVMLNRDDDAAEQEARLDFLSGDVDASADDANTAEISRRNEATKDANNADARYDVAPNVELFTEIESVAEEKGFHVVSEQMGIVNAVLGDLRARNLV